MNIKTNKDFSHVTINNYDMERLTNEELGELIRIGYQKSRTKEFFNKNVEVSCLVYYCDIKSREDEDLIYEIMNNSTFKKFELAESLRTNEDRIVLKFKN